MADTESKKMLAGLWASDANADRADPEAENITRTQGWTVAYEQQRSGRTPEREVFNQLFRELTGLFVEKIRLGGVLFYDQEIDYYQYARVLGSDGRKYVALVANGPSTANISDPVADSGRIWRLY